MPIMTLSIIIIALLKFVIIILTPIIKTIQEKLK